MLVATPCSEFEWCSSREYLCIALTEITYTITRQIHTSEIAISQYNMLLEYHHNHRQKVQRNMQENIKMHKMLN